MFLEITLKSKTDAESCCDANKTCDRIGDYLIALKHNGQILPDYAIVKNGEGYILYVTVPHEDSLSKDHETVYAARYREKLEKLFDFSFRKIGENVESREYCVCESHSFLEMGTYDCDVDSVFTCGDCGKPVALYKLPVLNGYDDHGDATGWQTDYASFDKIWLNSATDSVSGRQLFYPDSLLNKRGRAIAAETGEKLGCKVYYYMSDDCGFYKRKTAERVKTENGKVRLCPSCKKPMTKKRLGEDTILCCESCMLSCDDN